MHRLALVLMLVTACGAAGGSGTGTGEADSPHPRIEGDGLASCFADTYDSSDPEPAIARCEAKHFGTQWRKEPPRGGLPGGSIDPRLVQAGVRARLHRMRGCYKKALARDATLGGEVRVRFVIDLSGRATGAADAGSRLKNKEVVSCVVAEFSALRFPRPEGGTVPVVYPIVFAPGDT